MSSRDGRVETDVLRHYSHFLSGNSDIAGCHDLLARLHGDAYTQLAGEYEDLADYESRSGQDMSVFRRLGEVLGMHRSWNEQWVVFHYRSILHELEMASFAAMKALKGAGRYVNAVYVFVFLLVLANEFRIQPNLLGIYSQFGAEPPEGWRFARTLGFVMLPVAVASMVLTNWLTRSAGRSSAFIVMFSRPSWLPFLKDLRFAFRGYLTVKIIRFVISTARSEQEAVEATRQAVAIVAEDAPGQENELEIDRIIRSLDAADKLDVFTQELEYWESYSVDTLRAEVEQLASDLQPFNMSVLGLLVGAIIVQMYLWIFSIGEVFG